MFSRSTLYLDLNLFFKFNFECIFVSFEINISADRVMYYINKDGIKIKELQSVHYTF